MRIVFAGTPDFAVPSLTSCLAEGHDVCGVLTQPDRPAGRGRKVVGSPVKAVAAQYGIPVFQPESLRSDESQERLRELGANVMVVVAYGLILPPRVLEIPPRGCINVHASLLPRWRGAAPIQRAILAGDEYTGVTIMRVEPKLDAGPMYLQKSCRIHPDETAGQLHDRLAQLGAEALIETLIQVENGSARLEKQDESRVTYAEKLDKHEALLDWTQPASLLARKVRAFNPWPVAETRLQGEPLRIWQAEVVPEDSHLPPGRVLPNRNTWDVATGEGVLRLLEVQRPGRRCVDAKDFLRGRAIPTQMGD